MHKQHRSFSSPEDPNQLIWRYLDFTRFTAMLTANTLFFTRSDHLGDPYEGSLPVPSIKAREELVRILVEEHSMPKKQAQAFVRAESDFTQTFRKMVFINCWNMSSYESPALWSLYAGGSKGIAIQSTHQRLAQSFAQTEQEVNIGVVSYVDYLNYRLPRGNLLSPFLLKRIGFDHERELRAVFMKVPFLEDGKLDLEASTAPSGHSIAVDLRTLVQAVYVAPAAEAWIFDLVRTLAQKFSLQVPILHSELDVPPSF